MKLLANNINQAIPKRNVMKIFEKNRSAVNDTTKAVIHYINAQGGWSSVLNIFAL